MAKKLSRPNRRAQSRLKVQTALYDAAVKSAKSGSKAFTKPGSLKHW